MSMSCGDGSGLAGTIGLCVCLVFLLETGGRMDLGKAKLTGCELSEAEAAGCGDGAAGSSKLDL